MTDRNEKWRGLKIGDRVKCTHPDYFVAHLARAMRNRVGTIVRFQDFSGAPIVAFEAQGRRKAVEWVPPRRDDITVVEEGEGQ